MYEYKAKLIKVVDGDTVDAMIDCGFSVFAKSVSDLKVSMLQKVAQETKKKRKKD